MSYHLRALERWGIVEHGERRGTTAASAPGGRPGARSASIRRRSPPRRSTSSPARPSSTSATSFRRWATIEETEPKAWRDVAGVSRAYLWLTEEEAAEFDSDLGAVLKKYTADRDAEHHPEGTRRVFCLFAIVPEA